MHFETTKMGRPSAQKLLARGEFTVETLWVDITALAMSHGAKDVMIGGAPWMMSALERALRRNGLQYCYAFSVRESVEKTMPDGSIVKTNVFRHGGFI